MTYCRTKDALHGSFVVFYILLGPSLAPDGVRSAAEDDLGHEFRHGLLIGPRVAEIEIKTAVSQKYLCKLCFHLLFSRPGDTQGHELQGKDGIQRV